MFKVLGSMLLLIVAAATYLLIWPVPIEPGVWTPQPPRYLQPSGSLAGVQRLAEQIGVGPEGVAVDAQGRLYAGFEDGRVLRFDANGAATEQLADTGGRPLGLSVGGKELLVADAIRGLLQVHPDGRVVVLSREAEGQPFGFVDDVDQSEADPGIYFSDASTRFGVHDYMSDLLEHGNTGRLLRYDPGSGQTQVLMRGLHFANGVAIGPDAQYVLVAETAEYRIWRYWLKGERAGQQELFAEGLPGFPDNLSFNGRDRFWVAIAAPRNPQLDAMAARPLLRKLVFRLPEFLHPRPVLKSWVLGFDLQGRLVENLQYEGGAGKAYGPITSVEQRGEQLYLGSLTDTAIGRIALKPAAP